MSDQGYFYHGRWIPFKVSVPIVPDVESLHYRLTVIEEIVRGCFKYHADIHYRSDSDIIVCGMLNGSIYVNVFKTSCENLPEVIKILKSFDQSMSRGYIDVPFGARWL